MTGLVHYSNNAGASWADTFPIFVDPNPVVTSGNGFFMAATTNMIRTSTDSATWNSAVAASGSGNISALGYGNGKFLANDTPDGMSISTDNGVTWTTGQSADLGWISSIVYGGASGSELYLAGGADGKVYRSSDGTGFTNSTQVVTGGSINAIATKGAPTTRYVFATEDAHTGSLGGLSGADALCMGDPNKPTSGIGSGLTYKAMLNGNLAVKPNSVYFALTNNNLQVTTTPDWANNKDFFSDLTNFDNAIYLYNDGVWTGYFMGGTPATYSCSGFTSASSTDSGVKGVANQTDAAEALHSATIACNTTNKLYCVSQ